MTTPCTRTSSDRTSPAPADDVPDPTPDVSADPQCTKIAQAAATGLKAHADVADAVVRIDGTQRTPRLRIECHLTTSGDVSRTTELVVGVREQLEAMLDLTFDSAEMTIRNATGGE
jgi:hypothetical protein